MSIPNRRVCFFVCFLLLGCWYASITSAADFSGEWQGSFSSYSGDSGNISANITQTGSSLSGTLSVKNTECGDFLGLTLKGTISGDTATFGATATCPLDNEDYSLEYTQGRISGNTMNGDYSVSGPDYYDSGTFSVSTEVYTIEATAGAGGTIAPSGSVSVNVGASRAFTVTASAGYRISDIKVDGASVGPVTSYVFTNVRFNHIIVATFSTPAPVAAFTVAPRIGSSPLAVSFSDGSSGVITSRLWDFGDGSTSTDSNPSHRYMRRGIYTVSLTVTGPGGSDVETKKDYVTVEPGGAIPLMLLFDEDE
jgi:hypothetical protein